MAVVAPPIGGALTIVYMNDIGLWLATHGALGLVIYVAAFAVLAGFALLPTWAQAVLGGWAFGFAGGFPAALAGFLGGATIGYLLGRAASGDRVEKILAEKPKWRAVRDALVGDTGPGAAWRTLGIVTLLRAPPNSPFAITNLVMSSVHVKGLPFLIGTLVGMAPRTGVAVWLGAGIQDLAHDATRPRWFIVATIVSSIVVIVIVGSLANRALERFTRGHGAGEQPLP